MKLSTILVLALAVVAFGPACESTGSSNGSAGRSSARTGPGVDEGANPAAQYQDIDDCRVILYQPKNRTSMILVNRAHSKRDSLKGRQDLALGLRDGGYNVLSDQQIDELLEAMKVRNGALIASPFSRADERYLNAGPGDIGGYKGVIVVENGGQRTKYLGMSPQGNPALAQKYQIFADLKLLVATVYSASGPVEMPQSGRTGSGDTRQFNVPEPVSNVGGGR